MSEKPVSFGNATQVAVPSRLGRYRIERELGRGAMGCVYLAEDTQLGRKVALKIPQGKTLEEPEALERFYREARTTSTLQHPNICPVYDVGCIDGVHYLTMAYIPGKPVSSFIGKGKLPAARQVALLIRKIALALEEAHRKGVVHRDLKPANIMLNDRGEPVVMDFGLAVQLNTAENSRLTQSGSILGTPAYMSPEQVLGEIHRIGPASDIYALGVIMYQFLTGELPFTGSMMMVCAQIISNQPKRPAELRPDVDSALEAISLKMMAKDIGQRFGSMSEVAASLTELLKTEPLSRVDGTSTIAPARTLAADLNFDNLAIVPGVADDAESFHIRSTHRSKGTESRYSVATLRKRRWLLAFAVAALMLLTYAVISTGLPTDTETKSSKPHQPAGAEATGKRFGTEESLPKGRTIDLAADLSELSGQPGVVWKDEGLEVNSPNSDKAWSHSFTKYTGRDMILRGELQLLDGDQLWVAQRSTERGKYHFALRQNQEFFIGVETSEQTENDKRSHKSNTGSPVRFTFATIGDQILLFLDGKIVRHKFSTDSTLEDGAPSIGVYAARARFSNLSLELLDNVD